MYYRRDRRITLFETILILACFILVVIGFVFIRNMYVIAGEISWEMLIAVFAYIMGLGIFVMAAILVDIKEELTLINHEQLLETRLLREVSNDHMNHTKKMHETMKNKIGKKK